MKKILLIDDQDRFLNALKSAIESLGYAVDAVHDGAEALRLLSLHTYDAIVCDLQMPGMSGFEFLNVSRQVTQSPVILMTGFKELADADRATREGASAFVAKPFRVEEIRKILEQVTTQSAPLAEQVNLDDEYFPLLISEFLSGKTIQYDIFIRFNAFKYVKIAHSGEDLDGTRVGKFQEKGLRVFYLRKEDYKRYVSFLINLNTQVSESKNVDHVKKVKMLRLAGEVTLKGIFNGALKNPELDEAKMIVLSMNRIASEDDKLGDLLAALKDSGDELYAHAMGVSTLAVMIAQTLKWNNQATILSIGLAGFFHDIGKKEFPRSLLTKSRLKYTAEEVAMYESHPMRGANLLATLPNFPPEVLQAILQHHETCSGSGFPKHLKKPKIIAIARILTIADEFTKGLLPGPDCLQLTPQQIFGQMKSLKEDCFDAEYMKAFESVIVSQK